MKISEIKRFDVNLLLSFSAYKTDTNVCFPTYTRRSWFILEPTILSSASRSFSSVWEFSRVQTAQWAQGVGVKRWSVMVETLSLHSGQSGRHHASLHPQRRRRRGVSQRRRPVSLPPSRRGVQWAESGRKRTGEAVCRLGAWGAGGAAPGAWRPLQADRGVAP